MSDHSSAAFDDLVYALLDGTITEEEHEELSSELAASPESRRRYLALVEVHDLLEENAEEAGPYRPKEVIPIRDILSKQRQTQLKRAMIVAVAVVCISAILLKLVLVPETPPRTIQVKASPHADFTVSSSGSEEQQQPNALTVGSTLHLSQGALELNFVSGVRSVIQAPASVIMVSEEELVLDEGRAWFHVPKEAIGFQVTTEQVRVTDLGTEFAVVADRGVRYANDQVHVFKGKVEVQARHGLEKSQLLTEGEAVSVHLAGRLDPIEVEPERFASSLPNELPVLRWNFDGEEPLAADSENLGTGKIKTVMQGNPPVRVPGILGEAFEFSSAGGHLRTDWRGIDSDRPRTISCWIKCSRYGSKGAIVEWGIPETTSSKWRLTLNPELRGEGGVRGALRTEFGDGYVIGTTDLCDGRWHHVTSIYNGTGRGSPDSIQMYVDGKLEPVSGFLENDVDTIVDNYHSSPCLIGLRFEGCIDDMRIFEGALPVEMLDALAKPGPKK